MTESNSIFTSLNMFTKKLFVNSGKKIKVYAKVAFWVETIIFIIAGIALLLDAYGDEFYIILGISFVIGGPLTAWISALLLYGIGEIIDKVCNLNATADSSEPNEVNTSNPNNTTPMEEPRICPSCGKGVATHHTFCTKCGQKLD